MNNKIILSLLLVGLVFTGCSKDDDSGDNKNPDPNQNGDAVICGGFFEANEGTSNFVAGPRDENFSNHFTQGNSYEVVIFENGDLHVTGDERTFEFAEDMITQCGEGHETTVNYHNTTTGYQVILQKEAGAVQIIIYNDNGQVQLDRFAPADLSLLIERAGTYTVESMSAGAEHDRMTVIIETDGKINFDTDKVFGQDEISAVFDRLDCCNRIHVDLQAGGTMNLYWKGADLKTPDYISYSGFEWTF